MDRRTFVAAAARSLAALPLASNPQPAKRVHRIGWLRARTARTERNGVPLLPGHRGTTLVTPELVNQLRDEGP
jgi:hypothetical protein